MVPDSIFPSFDQVLPSCAFPVQSCGAHPGAQPLLSAGHFGDRQDGTHRGGSHDPTSRSYSAMRQAVLRSDGKARMAVIPRGNGWTGANPANGMDGFSALPYE